MQKIRQITFDSKPYWQIAQLREIVLRVPLGMRFDYPTLLNEDNEIIYAYFEESKPVSSLQYQVKNYIAKLRQVATHPKYRGRGIGSELYYYSENELKENGIETIYCHARVEVISYYLKLGFDITSEEFTEIGIPHIEMTKKLK